MGLSAVVTAEDAENRLAGLSLRPECTPAQGVSEGTGSTSTSPSFLPVTLTSQLPYCLEEGRSVPHGQKSCTPVSTSPSYDRVTSSAPPPTLSKYSLRTVNTTKSFKDDNNNEHSDWCHLSNDCWSGRPLPLAHTVSSHPDYSLTLTTTHTQQMKTPRRSEPPP